MDLHDDRREYLKGELRRVDLEEDPIKQFEDWLAQAFQSDVVDPPAMTVATVAPDGKPSQRIVLLKHVDALGFVFYTDYESKKGSDLDLNPNICLHFPWHAIERQVRVVGVVEKLALEESKKYFYSRPRGSQLAAAVSPQSQVISSRDELEKRYRNYETACGSGEVPFPERWGGYRVIPSEIEFWQGGANRLHNRFRYSLQKDVWVIERLAP